MHDRQSEERQRRTDELRTQLFPRAHLVALDEAPSSEQDDPDGHEVHRRERQVSPAGHEPRQPECADVEHQVQWCKHPDPVELFHDNPPDCFRKVRFYYITFLYIFQYT